MVCLFTLRWYKISLLDGRGISAAGQAQWARIEPGTFRSPEAVSARNQLEAEYLRTKTICDVYFTSKNDVVVTF